MQKVKTSVGRRPWTYVFRFCSPSFHELPLPLFTVDYLNVVFKILRRSKKSHNLNHFVWSLSILILSHTCTYWYLLFIYSRVMLMMTQVWNTRPWSIVANRTLNPAQLEWFHYWWSYSSSTDMGWTVELISAASWWRSRWWWRFSGL